MGGLGSGPRWRLGRLGLERATLRTTPYGMASEGQESRFPDYSKGRRDDVILADGIIPSEKRKAKRAEGRMTWGILYKKPPGSRGRARRALMKRVIIYLSW